MTRRRIIFMEPNTTHQNTTRHEIRDYNVEILINTTWLT